ncbi:MAG TPA: c-type cytochrome [Casimicrobiaceae bacterium]|jgi:thiosulfate dehydrogenase
MRVHSPIPLNALIASFIVYASVAHAVEPVPLSPPAATAIPTGPLGESVRYGQSLVTSTRSLAPAFVGNGLTCTNCHLDGGRVAYAAPFAGLSGVFPEYRARRGGVESLAERINDCFMRSMNGKPLPYDSREMIALLSYIAWLSEGVPTGVEVQGRGFKEIAAPSPPNPGRGETLYAAKCVACHGADGQGLRGAGNAYAFPPLWGTQSFNTGAGMARVSVAAAFVQAKMPLGNAGTLSDQDAYDIAAYFTSKPRPEFAARKNDWPGGGAPADARK